MEKTPLQLLLLIVFSFSLSHALVFPKVCNLLEENATMRVPGAHNYYITCKDEMIHDCGQADLIYDPNERKCVRNERLILSLLKPCLNAADNTLKISSLNCSSFYTCLRHHSYLTSCEKNHYFDEESQKCVPANESLCVMGKINNICDYLAHNTIFKHEKQDNIFYKCQNRKQLEHKCDKNYFNLETLQCAEGDQA